MSERRVSVESDSETLGRAGCQGEKAGSSPKAGLLRSGYPARHYARDCYDKVSCRETEGCTRAPAFTRAVATTRGGPVM